MIPTSPDVGKAADRLSPETATRGRALYPRRTGPRPAPRPGHLTAGTPAGWPSAPCRAAIGCRYLRQAGAPLVAYYAELFSLRVRHKGLTEGFLSMTGG